MCLCAASRGRLCTVTITCCYIDAPLPLPLLLSHLEVTDLTTDRLVEHYHVLPRKNSHTSNDTRRMRPVGSYCTCYEKTLLAAIVAYPGKRQGRFFSPTMPFFLCPAQNRGRLVPGYTPIMQASRTVCTNVFKKVAKLYSESRRHPLHCHMLALYFGTI